MDQESELDTTCNPADSKEAVQRCDIAIGKGLFISPFKAQAKEIHSWLATEGLHSWSASTVHSQQGSEADIVVFDSVNAGSYGWPYDEWKRLVNVALSRAREASLFSPVERDGRTILKTTLEAS